MGLIQFENGLPVYYQYTPSATATYTYLTLFTVVTIGHIGLMWKWRTWYFIPMILGGICELFGHYGRAWASSLPDSPRPFMLQLMLILVAPVFLSATVHVTLGKLKEIVLGLPKPRCGPTSLFVLTDIVAFCSQIGGSLVQVTGNLKIMNIGDHVVLGGLLFQLVVMIIYLLLVLRFQRQARREVLNVDGWERYVLMLIVSVAAIWVRNLVRAIEFVQEFYGFVSQHEAMLYIFDSSLMLLVMVVFIVLHLGRFLRAPGDDRWRKVQSFPGPQTQMDPYEMERLRRGGAAY